MTATDPTAEAAEGEAAMTADPATDTGKHTVTKVTVNLNRAAREALDTAADIEGNNRTDTINRALQAYAQLVAEQADGWTIQLRRPAKGVWGWLGFGRVQEFRIVGAPSSEAGAR